MAAWLLGAIAVWLVVGLIGAALYLREAAKVEILPYDLFMAGVLVLFGPLGFTSGQTP